MADFILSKISQLAMSRAESQLENSAFNIVIKVQECDPPRRTSRIDDRHCLLAPTMI